MSDISIREAEPEDSALILGLIHELAVYERAANQVLATEDAIRDALFADGATVSGLICRKDGVDVGFAVYFFNFSTWLGKRGLYLEDLFVSPSHRGTGAGKALLKHLAQLALAKGCGRFEWNVLDWNAPAIGFYESIGAEPQSEWTGYRLAGSALARFANSD